MSRWKRSVDIRIDDIRGAVDRIDTDTSTHGDTLVAHNRHLRQCSKRIDGARGAFTSFKAAMQNRFHDVAIVLSKLRTKVNEHDKSIDNIAESVNDINATVDGHAAKFKNHGDTLHRNKKGLGKLFVDVKALTNHLLALNRSQMADRDETQVVCVGLDERLKTMERVTYAFRDSVHVPAGGRFNLGMMERQSSVNHNSITRLEHMVEALAVHLGVVLEETERGYEARRVKKVPATKTRRSK